MIIPSASLHVTVQFMKRSIFKKATATVTLLPTKLHMLVTTKVPWAFFSYLPALNVPIVHTSFFEDECTYLGCTPIHTHALYNRVHKYSSVYISYTVYTFRNCAAALAVLASELRVVVDFLPEYLQVSAYLWMYIAELRRSLCAISRWGVQLLLTHRQHRHSELRVWI